VAVTSNWCRCTSCHAGYGWKDAEFDFSSQENVDCLVCHDSTGKYKKFPTDCGHPAYEEKKFMDKVFPKLDLKEIAQNVSNPDRRNCGACHFFGGGGNGVKHGDLDTSLLAPSKALDVHMDKAGLNYSCGKCHTTEAHHIEGRHYSDPASNDHNSAMPKDNRNRIACESCHSATPHKNNEKLNHHTDKVACQTCHIPAFARENPTVMWWDWSKAGKKAEDGKPVKSKNEQTGVEYTTMKGEQHWKKNQSPDYYWYNGSMTYIKAGDRIALTAPVKLSVPAGGQNDPNSRIAPFKIHKGIQPVDEKNQTILIPKLFGKPGSGAYWADYDWQKAGEIGMAAAGLPFSGHVGFAETWTFWPINHMVAPKEQSLKCDACHSGVGRLKDLGGFYMPGRDKSRVIDMIGWGLVGLYGIGAGLHGILRLFKTKK